MTSIPTVTSANCVGCRRAVDVSWSFCPSCGADNRDPALHQGSVDAHNHDLRFGAHCVLCGATGGGQSALPQGMWKLPPWWKRLIIALLIGSWGALALNWHTGDHHQEKRYILNSRRHGLRIAWKPWLEGGPERHNIRRSGGLHIDFRTLVDFLAVTLVPTRHLERR